MEIESDKQKFTLYKRKLKAGVFYYARFREASGVWGSGVNTGQKSVQAAMRWAEAKLAGVVASGTPTLAVYSVGFFDIGGPYCEDRQLFGGRGSGEKNLAGHRWRLERYILPRLGQVRLDQIDGVMIKDFQLDLSRLVFTRAGKAPRPFDKVAPARALSSQSIVHIVNTLSIIIRHAAENGTIKALPAIRRASIERKPRGCLTVDEALAILGADWPDRRHRAINILAAMSGMRQAELLGLQWGAVHPEYLEAFAAWNETLKSVKGSRDEPATKSGRCRNIPLPEPARTALEGLRMMARPGSSLVFELEPGRVLRPWNVTKTFQAVAASCGVDYKGRRIDFHSWRHFYNSLLVNARVPLPLVQATVGHGSMAMTGNYYHSGDGQVIAGAVESIFL